MLDEFMVTKRTLPTHSWTLKSTNVELDMSRMKQPNMACIIAVSQEIGLEKIEVYRNSINKTKFKSFLDNLRHKYPFDNIMLVMDNLSVHKSLEVRQRMDELGFMYSYTPEYSP